MARPQISKTPLGQRLTDVRKALGYEARLPFAQLLEMHPDTLGGYERGDTIPDYEFLTTYKRKFSVNLVWVITGEGDMFETDANSAPTQIDPELLEIISDKVAAVFHDAGQKPPQRRLAREAGNIYNALVSAVRDISDREMVEAALPMILLEFKRKLERAAAEPGTGKRSAS